MKLYTVEELQSSTQIPELNNKGVYVMKCLATNEEYVGSTTRDFRRRWKELRKHCRNNKAKVSKLLRQYWSKYGDEGFVFGILEITNSTKQREQYWIDTLQPALNQRKEVAPYIEAKFDWKSTYGGDIYKDKVEAERERKVSIIKSKLQGATVHLNTNKKKMWVLKTQTIELKFTSLKTFCKDNDIPYSWLCRSKFYKEDWLPNYGISLEYIEAPQSPPKLSAEELLMQRIRELRDTLNSATVPSSRNLPRWCIETDTKKLYIFSLNAFCKLNNIQRKIDKLCPQYAEHGVKVTKLF